MRVTFVTSGLGTGGAEFALLRLVIALRNLDVQASVVSLDSAGSIGPMLVDEGVPVSSMHLNSETSWLKAFSTFKRHLCDAKPQIVQGWMYHANLASLGFGRSDGVRRPVLWGVRQSLTGTRDKWSTKAAIKASAFFSTRPQAIVYNSHAARRQHANAHFADENAVVIPNGFDLEQLAKAALRRPEARHQLRIGSEEIVVGHVARYHVSKDHEAFLVAAGQISQRFPKVRFVMAGEGICEENHKLMAQIRALNLAKSVHLLGRCALMAPVIASFDVLCMSSSGMEGFPNVVAEAMGCCVPCVGTDVGDTREIIGDTGLIVPPSNPAALANALTRLLGMLSPERRALGTAARARIESRFSIASVAQTYHGVYLTALAKSS